MMKNLKRPNLRFKGGLGQNCDRHAVGCLKIVLQWLCNGLFRLTGGFVGEEITDFQT
jgi:hypothetical protein